jgi:CHAD domain-containing protein
MSITRSALLAKRLEHFTRALKGLEQGDVRALHRARVASRRLRELLPILQVAPNATRKLTRRFRKVTTRLGIVRELDVLLLLIDELHVSRREASEALSRVAVAVAKARDDAREQLFERMSIDDLWRLARKLERVDDDLEAAEGRRRARMATTDRRWQSAVAVRVARRAERLGAAIRNAGALYLPERLHDVRIALKKLRYAAELAADVAGQRSTPELRALKRGQEVLGRMHDLQVLIDHVRQVQASLTPPSLAMWQALDGLVTLLENDCRQLHARYMQYHAELEAIADRLSGTHSDEGRAGRTDRELVGGAAVIRKQAVVHKDKRSRPLRSSKGGVRPARRAS